MTANRSAARPKAVEADTGKREKILDAALELFAERGFHGTAVPLVAERAGVAAGTLYRYFESKEALVNELYRMWKHKLGAALLTEFPSHEAPRKAFHEMWRRLARFAEIHPRAFTFLELHHHGAYLDGKSRQLNEDILSLVREFINHAQSQRAIKPIESHLLISLVLGAFAGMLKACDAGLVKLTPKALEQAEACMWEAIRA